MAKRVEWVITAVDPSGKPLGPTYRLARLVGTATAARWQREARTLRPSALRRKSEDHRN